MNTEADVRQALSSVHDATIDRSIIDLDMVPLITVDGGRTQIAVELPTPAYPDRDGLAQRIETAVLDACSDIQHVGVEFSATVKGKNAGGAIGLKVKNILAVGSGKGGVGKSTVAAALAYGLKECGASIGLMDADVYGPSIPHLVGATGQPTIKQMQGDDGKTVERLEPLEADGIKLMSMGFMIEKDQAVIWRGPLLHRALTQFLQQTDWGELDYLIIDMPPGTGDVALTLSQMVGLAGAVVVCTPQEVALLDAVKAISMFNQVKVPVLGMVENMSGDIFGRGGTKAMAAERGLPFLGEIPSEAAIRVKGDAGKVSELYAADSPAREPLMHVCEQTAMQIAKGLLDAPEMPTLEIL